MSDERFDTVQLHHWIEQWQAGDNNAADTLLRAFGKRLEELARKMLFGFSELRDWYDTPDIVQGASLRLINALRSYRPTTTRDLLHLAALTIRRELLDLARHFRGKKTISLTDLGRQAEAQQIPAPDAALEELELWCRFHEAIEALPIEEREVVSLAFYHGWTQAQIAELMEVDMRTIRRRWQIACRKLRRQLGGKLPLSN